MAQAFGKFSDLDVVLSARTCEVLAGGADSETPTLAGEGPGCLCDRWWGAFPRGLCPVEHACSRLGETGLPEAHLYARQRCAPPPEGGRAEGERAEGEREFDLFLVHYREAGGSALRLRLLPFPSSMTLRIKHTAGGVKVSVDGLWTGIVIPCAELESAAQLSPAESSEQRGRGSRDAAALLIAFPGILDRIRNDHDLSLAAACGSETDRERYYILHIPIEELEAQDRYMGWLPQARDYRDERERRRRGTPEDL